jgi:hypothetical protein
MCLAGPPPKRQIDEREAVVPVEQQHPSFRDLCAHDAFLPARKMISELMCHFTDIDGTFARNFQTQGFDARLWEFYLNAYLMEERLFIEREHASPDFIVRKYGKSVAIEAVTVGRRTAYTSRVFGAEPKPEATLKELGEKLRNEVPILFGSPLYSKLRKRYWNLPHVRDIPLVFAIADFHDDQSMLWTSPALMNYLYGLSHDFYYKMGGELAITPHTIVSHESGSKSIPSGYFFQPEAENVSAVLFSASGTISKFSRLGIQAGFGHPDVKVLRMGACHDHDPSASTPKMFAYEVTEKCTETWAEGLSMFHNPNALHPVPQELFPSVAHHRLQNGQIASQMPDFHPYNSFTYHLRSRRQGPPELREVPGPSL